MNKHSTQAKGALQVGFGVKSIYLPAIGFSLVNLEARNNLNVEYIEIDTIILTIQQTW